MPCSDLGQSNPWPGPPQERSRLPCVSNSRTGGAAMQHRERCGVREAPSSSTVYEAGRCKTQMWSSRSTANPPTCPMIQLLGSSCGQEGTTWYFGGSWAGVAGAKAMIAETTVVSRTIVSAVRQGELGMGAPG